MCGIAGFIQHELAGHPDELRRRAQAMAATLAHRGPDGEGVWVDAAAGVALAHRRLAVIDLSDAAAQPMRTAHGDYTLIYNGEIYNAAQLRRDLEAAGYSFRSRSDSEVLLAACVAWGVETALRRVTGMFAFGLWDGGNRRLVLARDRMGMKPLYWRLHAGGLAFASELKALRADPDWRPALDRESFAAFFSRLYVPSQATIYAGVESLPPGTALVFCPGRPPDLVRYWSLAQAVAAGCRDPLPSSDAAIAEAMEALLPRVVSDHLIADVPTGAFLSGGIDSTTVTALAAEGHNRSLSTFAIGYGEPGFDESGNAKAVADHLGTDHHQRSITAADALTVIPRLADTHDELMADGSQVPTRLVSALARERVTVALSGDGGDELFGGYDRYWERAAQWQAVARLPAFLRPAAAAVLGVVPDSALAAPMRRLGLLADARQSLPVIRTLLALPTIDRYYATSQWVWDQPPVTFAHGQRHPAEWRELPRAVADPLVRMQYADSVTVLPDDLLPKVDRASMAVGLEVRMPLLDHRVVELACRIPPGARRKGVATKWPLRLMLDRRVPKRLIDRTKMGFHMPMTLWMRGPLRAWAEEMLAPARLSAWGLFDVARVQDHWRDFLADRPPGRTYDAVWGVLMASAWLERWGKGLDLGGD
ncbi:asparagine synthase (glutamine-hydrolyzing) [Magnetospirillum moscoviense]|uniref:asparagine synthase (glutamine-hydrolyzing) n=1 Tax=Magnetospirillum moscoviense TaxID=1437059 RepID=A0A178MYN1_9PROT|nr:asparagine synthase (glutamine-hydrolyzing) [Magnetospirillum moscoviense]OAN55058.1 hypothetical protein A6A05_00415 [Magnetospirillum moscoviense]